jgi:hypothetical protein
MEGAKVAATLNRKTINNPAAWARNGGRWTPSQSLAMIKLSLLLIA